LTNNASIRGFTHNTIDGLYSTDGFQYRYYVVDSLGGTGSDTVTITPAAYIAPTAIITQTATITSPQSVTRREKGNTLTNISATITRNSPNVNLTGFTFEFSTNNSTYISTGITGITSGTTGSWSTGVTAHAASGATASIRYRIRVRDDYQDSLGSSVIGGTASLINLYNIIFYGATGTVPSTGSSIRGLEGKTFTDSSLTFNLNTGITHIHFVFATPDPSTISQVLDLETASSNITAQYILSTGVTLIPNYIGTDTEYNVYVMSNSVPYGENHRHQITRT
jgi:hypothetical protein